MENQKIIDAHVMLGEEHPLSLQVDDLLRRMDTHGIERAGAIARPMGAELVIGNQAGNNRVLQCGPRVCGLVSVNPWYGSQAIQNSTLPTSRPRLDYSFIPPGRASCPRNRLLRRYWLLQQADGP